MRNYTIFIALFIVVLLLFMIPSGQEQRNEQQERTWQNQLDSLEKVYKDSLHKRELFYLKSFNDAMRKADKLEGEAKHWKRKYHEEVRNNRSFSDAAIDSLLSRI
jgi:Flp pilus assembly protein TadB